MKNILLLLVLGICMCSGSMYSQAQESSASNSDKVESSSAKSSIPLDINALQGVEAETFYLGLNAVIWGYPAVFFEDLMRARTRPDIVNKGNPQSAVNQFGMVRHLRGPEYKQIATPNTDTYYSQSFCDVSREPLVMHVPKVDANRYYAMQLWDPNGDTFGYVGSRTTGRGAGDYALVGPDWKGDLPKGVERIDCAYNSFVIWGRIGINGPGDEPNVHAIQDKLRLHPLSQFGKSETQLPPDLEFSDERVKLDIPDDLPEGLEYYFELANSLKHTPPKPQDIVVAKSLSSIGFTDNNTKFDYQSLKPAQIKGLIKAYTFGLHLMDVQAQTTGNIINGWRWSPISGIMGDDYLFRAAFAKWFTGGNSPDEAIYLDGRMDEKGNALDGSKKYRIRFEKGQHPPVNAFWSLSMYNLSDGSFVANSIDRYAIKNNTEGMVINADGALEIYIQNEAPTAPNEKANWLPAPAKGFYMNLRLYNPDNGLMEGTWSPPFIIKLD